MAEAVVEERHLIKSLRWWDGFTIAMCNPGFLFGSLGFTLGIFGVVGSVILWGVSAIIGMILTWIYIEPAMMFPDQSGGISFTPMRRGASTRRSSAQSPRSATGSAGRSCSRSSARSSATWSCPAGSRNSTWSVYDGVVHLGLANFIAIGVIAGVWAFNIFGIRPMKGLTYVTAGLLFLVLIFFMFVPYISGDWHSSNVHATFTAPGAAPSWCSSTCSSSAGRPRACEVCATFAPEYKTERDTHIAMRSAAIFVVGVFILVPLGLGGVTGVPATADAGGPVLQHRAADARRAHVRYLPADLPDRQPDPVDVLLDRRRQPSPVRDLAGRPDDQAAWPAQPLARTRAGDDRRSRRQRPAGAVHLQQPGDSLHEQHRLHPRPPARGQRFPAVAQGSSQLAAPVQAVAQSGFRSRGS